MKNDKIRVHLHSVGGKRRKKIRITEKDMNDILLTVVIPIYNVELYIRKCLDSCVLFMQNGDLDIDNMNQLEVILVNDGTPDNSAELSREYTYRYPQTFRQIDKENGGHGSAWNVGLKEAKGRYIRFLDSDDWLTNLGNVMEKLKNTDADVVFTDYVIEDCHNKKSDYQSLNSPTGVLFPMTKQLFEKQQKLGPLVLNFWHSTYKTSILQPQWPLFEEHVMYDDSILCQAPLLYGRTYIYYDIPLYHYLVGRSGQSMDMKVMKRNINSYIRCYNRQEEWMNNAMQCEIPLDLKECIKQSVHHYACLVFGRLLFLPYQEAKVQMYKFYHLGYKNTDVKKYKIAIRYEKYPFFLFYSIEYIRNFLKALPLKR